jgi:hypothetical protein
LRLCGELGTLISDKTQGQSLRFFFPNDDVRGLFDFA